MHVVQQEVTNGIRSWTVWSEVVLHEETRRREEVDRVLGVVGVTCVEEDELERRTDREMLSPVADEQLDVGKFAQNARLRPEPVQGRTPQSRAPPPWRQSRRRPLQRRFRPR